MHEKIKFNDTVRFTLSEKLALKTPNVLIKKMPSFVDFALFFGKIDGLLRYGTIGYGTVRYGTVRYGRKFGIKRTPCHKGTYFRKRFSRFNNTFKRLKNIWNSGLKHSKSV
jgi:hypothetical protein